jgi:hypothetical protein
VWHSHRYTCSTAKAGRFRRENRLYRKPANIPTCGTGSPVVYDGEDVTIVLAFDRDWTVDVNAHPRREAVPLEYVRHWKENTKHEVWATGNQLLVEEAKIPGTVESVRRLRGDIKPFGEKDEQTGRYENWPEREKRLKILEKLFPDADEYIVIDDLDLKHVDNWNHYYAWNFMEALRNGELSIEKPTPKSDQEQL